MPKVDAGVERRVVGTCVVTTWRSGDGRIRQRIARVRELPCALYGAREVSPRRMSLSPRLSVFGYVYCFLAVVALAALVLTTPNITPLDALGLGAIAVGAALAVLLVLLQDWRQLQECDETLRAERMERRD